MKFEPLLPALSDSSSVTGDDDRSSETPSREELSELEPSTHYKKINVHGASLDVSEEYRKAREKERRTREELRRKAREEQAKVREEQGKAFEVEINSHERSDFHGSLAKPLKMEREEVDPNVFYGHQISFGGSRALQQD